MKWSITIAEPADLGCFKPGTIIDTNGYHDPTFMSIGDDQWVSSNGGTIIPKGVLFMELIIEIRTHRLFGE
mgnify:CR=1 FL=1